MYCATFDGLSYSSYHYHYGPAFSSSASRISSSPLLWLFLFVAVCVIFVAVLLLIKLFALLLRWSCVLRLRRPFLLFVCQTLLVCVCLRAFLFPKQAWRGGSCIFFFYGMVCGFPDSKSVAAVKTAILETPRPEELAGVSTRRPEEWVARFRIGGWTLDLHALDPKALDGCSLDPKTLDP